MAQDRNTPNPAANKSKAEGDRWGSEPDTVERVDREAERQIPADEAGGITNRPLEEEQRSQDRVPDRGDEEIIPRTREERGTTARQYEKADDQNR